MSANGQLRSVYQRTAREGWLVVRNVLEFAKQKSGVRQSSERDPVLPSQAMLRSPTAT